MGIFVQSTSLWLESQARLELDESCNTGKKCRAFVDRLLRLLSFFLPPTEIQNSVDDGTVKAGRQAPRKAPI